MKIVSNIGRIGVAIVVLAIALTTSPPTSAAESGQRILLKKKYIAGHNYHLGDGKLRPIYGSLWPDLQPEFKQLLQDNSAALQQARSACVTKRISLICCIGVVAFIVKDVISLARVNSVADPDYVKNDMNDMNGDWFYQREDNDARYLEESSWSYVPILFLGLGSAIFNKLAESHIEEAVRIHNARPQNASSPPGTMGISDRWRFGLKLGAKDAKVALGFSL